MTINITLPELEAGEAIKNISKKRITDWKAAVMRNNTVKLTTPIQFRGKTYRAAVLTSITPHQKTNPDTGIMELKGYKVGFRPVWARCYRGCHFRRSDIRILVVEFEDEQLSFDGSDRPSKSSFTVNGSGVGRDAEQEAESFFGSICGDDEENHVIRGALRYVSEKYGKAVTA